MNIGWTQALMQPEAAVPAGWGSHLDDDAQRRMNVYRNNVAYTLQQALGETFSACRHWLGESAFAALASLYWRRSPPRTPVLMHWGDGFAECLFELWLCLDPQAEARGSRPLFDALADLARLEWLRVQSFHADDEPACPAEEWSRWLTDAERLPDLRWRLCPHVALVRSAAPLWTLWSRAQTPALSSTTAPARALGEVLRDQPAESVLVWRHDWEVWVQPLAPAAAQWVQAVRDGACLGQAWQDAADLDPTFDPSPVLAILLQQGCVAGVLEEGETT